jgi:uncharacterized integral membrane protein
MGQYHNRNRFIPYRKSDIIDMCMTDSRLEDSDKKSFSEFCRILESLFHFEFHRQLEELKDCYAPFNPASDTRNIHNYSEEEKKNLQTRLVQLMTDIVKAGNFEKITEKDLEEALQEESIFKIRLKVDFDDFEEIIFYRRGMTIKKETLVKFYGLKKEPIEFTNYERVVIYIKFKEEDYFKSEKRKNLYFTPGSTVIKLFHNVPKADLEMVFPNSEVRMKAIDKIIIGIPALASGIALIVSKLGASFLLILSIILFWIGVKDEEVQIKQQHLIAFAVGFGTLGGFIFKQINKFKNRKIKFMKALADNLYFKNLDNNLGVFHHLIDSAEEEEFKEAVLAYYFLLTEKRELTKKQLDDTVEQWFEDRYNTKIDFEIEDALYKLERLELVRWEGNILRCNNLTDAKKQLDKTWDNYFTYNS